MIDTTDRFDRLQIERLIDGELSSAERVALLKRLDRTPDGWRMLATALMEDQVLRAELPVLAGTLHRNGTDLNTPSAASTIRTEIAIDERPTADTLPSREATAQTVWQRGIRFAPAIAAIAVAFAVGIVAGRGTSRDGEPGRPTANRPDPRLTPVANRRQPTPRVGTKQQPGDVRFVVGEGDAPLKIQPQVGSVSDIRVPDHVRAAIHRSGHELVRERTFVPIVLPDGRRAIVPVDEFELRYTGRRGYQ